LGNLFRSRGETDRALRIHQSLLVSTSLTFEQKLLVMHQLGLDYIAIGFYDRAEKIYLELMDDNEYQLSALQQLLFIYQMLKEWQPDRKSTRLNSSHVSSSYAVSCMQKKQAVAYILT